jgi:phage shock protein A
MAAKKGNGHDPLTVRMVEVLERIETELKGVREDLKGQTEVLRQVVGGVRTLHEEMRGLRTDVGALTEDVRAIGAEVKTMGSHLGGIRSETVVDFEDVREKLDEHEARLAALEKAG